MITTLAVKCAPILHCSQDARKTAAETSTDEMVMGAVWALCEFALLLSPQNHSDISLAAHDDALQRFYKKQGAFRDSKMSKSVKIKVDELLTTRAHHLCEQKIYNVYAAIEV
jgi:hypothetical protein